MNENCEKLPKVAEAMRMLNERNQLRASLKTYWFESFNVIPQKRTLSLLCQYAQESGEAAVQNWISTASINEIPAKQALGYIKAIRPKKDLGDDF